MYEFIDVQDPAAKEDLPLEACKINGDYLDELVPGFQTLQVEGREPISFTHYSSGESINRVGDCFYGKGIPPRTLKVRYAMRRSSQEEYLQSFDKLKNILVFEGKEITVSFRDESFVYYGHLEEMEQPEPGRLHVVSAFSILCHDPWKYGLVRSAGAGLFQETRGLHYPVKIEAIEISPTKSHVKIENTSTGDKIILNGVTTGEPILINFDSDRIWQKHADITGKLSFEESSFPEFELRNGQTIVQEGGTIVIHYRPRRL